MPDRLTLAFDTSAAHCAAALLSGTELLESRFEDMTKGQAERLMGLLQEILATHGLGFGDLDVIGVGTGPGNFTGIRISVAAARGLALSTRAEAVGVSRFEAATFGLPFPAIACFDAKRGAVYVQDFTDQGPGTPRVIARDALAAAGLPAGAKCVGDAAEAASEACGGGVGAPPYPLAEAIGRLAQIRSDGAQPRPKPLYLRAADAAHAAPGPVLIP